MSNNIVINSSARFAERTPQPQGLKRAVASLGRFHSRPSGISNETAVTYGKRRLAFLAAPVVATLAVVGVIKTVENTDHSADRYAQTIGHCTSVLVGHEVDIRVDQETGLQIIPDDIFTQVQACRLAGGDLDLAKQQLPVSPNS